MSFATAIRPALESCRGLGGALGLRPHSVAVLAGTWSEGTLGDGTETVVTSTIQESGQNPIVKWLSDAQIAMSETAIAGSCRIGPLTPSHSIGGVELATLTGSALSAGQTLHLLITGPKHPSGRRYAIKKLEADSALHYHLECTPV